MKTVTIPFDLEMAKKIQSGEVEGKIVDKRKIEYEIRIYVPMFKIDNHDVINRRYLNKVYIAIYNAIKDRFGDNFHFCNHHLDTWNPMAKFKFYIQIPNFK